LVVSELVHREASVGDPQAVRERLEALVNLPVLAVSRRSENFAQALIAGEAVPSAAAADALHIALAVVNGIEYLVTWNFKHIANAVTRSRINDICVAEGYDPCVICTPEELLEPEGNV
jgi:predicted nucleic acid-binding protein